MKINNQKIDIKDRRVSIIGLGKSGYAAAKLAIHLKAKVHATDNKKTPLLIKNKKNLELKGAKVELGGHTNIILKSKLWILSPGISLNEELTKQASFHNIEIISEIEFASWYAKFPIIGVTGSNGKTTTVNLIYNICKNTKINPALAGNVGIAFSLIILEDLITPPQNRTYILEVSSFQMERVILFKPKIAVFLNITPDHLDRYKNIDEYISAKMKMVKNSKIDDFIIFNNDDKILKKEIRKLKVNKISFSLKKSKKGSIYIKKGVIYDELEKKLIDTKKLLIPGLHNIQNILAAINIAKILKISNKKISSSIYNFKGVEHRIEYVLTINGVKYYNDSKATNIESVKAALNSFDSPIHLILGGKDKGSDFNQFKYFLKNKNISIVAYGEAAKSISTSLGDAASLSEVGKLEEAVVICNKKAHPGEIVLLSPGCASYDQFLNFEERGNFFKKTLNKIAFA